MAKETMIVFVYDTECCQDEADDPVEAVLYFYPGWVSDSQKLSLCGQLMGTTFFLNSCFAKPKIISLQNGKFVLKEFGRFILAVGTDRNISDSLLEHRADLLTSLIKFYHHNIQTIFEQFSFNGQYKNLTEKLYHIFETYLPILQHNANIFQNIPKLRLPKSASNIFLDAIQTLQSCQQNKGVLGGALLYHNKVVATQLSEIATKNLVLTDPYRIKSTAETISVDFHVPNGVQIMIIYIPMTEYQKLQSESQRAQNLITQNLPSSSNVLAFAYQKRKMKRDKSLIFTNIPEEDLEHSQLNNENSLPTTTNSISGSRAKSVQRPTHLPLRFKNVITKDLPESGFASINFDESDSYPEFIGRTSVCSTPMTENKILCGNNLVSICANPLEQVIITNNDKKVNKTETERKFDENVPRNNLDLERNNFFQNIITNPHKLERRNSLTDIHDSLKKISKRMSLRPFGLGLSKLDDNKTAENYSLNSDNRHKSLKTISDPMYPIFNSVGEPMSKSLFEEFLERYYTSWQETKSDKKISQLIEDFKEFDNGVQKLGEKFRESDVITNKRNVSDPVNIDQIEQKIKSSVDRKLLSLPIKPLNETNDNSSSNNGIFDNRRKLSGIQLTPLMAKLSILALSEERSNNFSTREATPVYENSSVPLDTGKLLRKKSLIKNEISGFGDTYRKVELYVCGQQNMTMFLFLEEGSAKKQELVQGMFDICVSRLKRLEAQLNQTLNINVDAGKFEGGYSFVAVDPKWDTIHRNGPWTQSDFTTLEYMHKDLNMSFPITDMMIRTDENVLYGYKCGKSEIFYKEPANSLLPGLPPPIDPMSTISSKAKRRLERDHSYVLF